MYTRFQNLVKANEITHSWRDKILGLPHVSPDNTTQPAFWFCFSRWKYCYPSGLTTHTWLPATATNISWKTQILPEKDFLKLYWTFLVLFFFAWPLFYSTELLSWSFFPYSAFLCRDIMYETHWAIETIGLYTMAVKKRIYDNPLVSSCKVTRRNYCWKTLLISKVRKNILLLMQKNMKCKY